MIDVFRQKAIPHLKQPEYLLLMGPGLRLNDNCKILAKLPAGGDFRWWSVFKYAMKGRGVYMRNLFAMLLGCGIILSLAACGGGGGNSGTTPTPTPALTVTPSSATVGLGAAQQFTAMNGTTAATATWSVNGVQGGNSTVGTIDSTGKYTAPSSFPSPNTFMVNATASGASGNASLTVAFPNNNHTSQSPPIKLGSSGGNATDLVKDTTTKTVTCCSGTLGSLVIKGGSNFILSNNHVLFKSDTGSTSDPVQQPGLVDNNCDQPTTAGGLPPPSTTVSNSIQAAPLKPTSTSTTGACAGATVPCGPAANNVDAALALANGNVDPTGTILDLGPASSNSIAAAPPSSNIALPTVGQGVAKSGRSTGLTCSTVTSVTTTVTVDYDSSCGGAKAFTAVFSNQVVINGGSFSAGGDSGSLVVTSDNARPVGLLFAGNSTSTTANPIQAGGLDVETALGPFVFPTNADHPVSCDPIATISSISTTVGASSTKLSVRESGRATAAKEKNGSRLFADPAVRDIAVGASADNPKEGAVVITVNGPVNMPPTLDGVRTRIVYANVATPQAAVDALNSRKLLSASRAEGLMSQPGIQGVGVGISDDNPAEPAIVIYTVAGIQHPEILAVIDGLRTKIVEGDRFRAFGWGKETKASACSPKQAKPLPKLP